MTTTFGINTALNEVLTQPSLARKRISVHFGSLACAGFLGVSVKQARNDTMESSLVAQDDLMHLMT